MGMLRLTQCLLLCVTATVAVAQVPKTWTATEELRIGGDTGPYLFTNIVGIAPTTGGNVFLLDQKAQEIRVFDASGKFVRLAARKGHGPGEITNAYGLIVAPDGAVWANDPANARFSIYKPDGRFDHQLLDKPLGWRNPWGAVFDTGGRLLAPIMVPKDTFVAMVYRRLSQDGSRADTLAFPACPVRARPQKPFTGMTANGQPVAYHGVPFQPVSFQALDRTGVLWCTSGETYSVYGLRLGRGDTVAVIRLDAPYARVTSEERAEIIAQIDSQFARYPRRDIDYSRIPSTKPPMSGLFTDDSGRLWVRRAVALANATDFDVWDSRGRQIATVRIPARVNMDWVVPVVVGDAFYAVVTDDDDVQSVIRVRLKR
jgi:hypothetical protein